MSEEKGKCPFCGMYLKSEQIEGQVDYQCDTIISNDFPDYPQFGRDCLMRQVSHCSGLLGESLDQIADLKARLEAWRAMWNAVHSAVPSHYGEYTTAIANLKELGELP